ncbi:hypothetical protein M0805_006700 [Coniferiporia weirii]|nr:hypothetical protein M0805_006700 [Coniferiporia weirii]
MAFPVPDHLPRRAPPQDVSSQILSKISDATNKTLSAGLAAEWVSELELSIQQTETRIYERIHDKLPNFERQLGSSRSVQTRLRDLSTNVDSLSDSLSNSETGPLPKLFGSLKVHSELAQQASNARAVHEALEGLSQCTDHFEALTQLVNNGKLPEGVASGDILLKVLEGAPDALAKANIMADMKQQLRALMDRIEEQLSEAYSRSVRISPTEFHISPAVQVRQSQTIITLPDILSCVSEFSLNSHLSSLRRDIVAYFINFPLQQAASSNISQAPDANGTPSICLSLFPLPPSAGFRKSTIGYLKVLFDFLCDHLFPTLPPSARISFPQSLYRPTASSILRDVLIPSLPSDLSTLPSFLALVQDAVQFEHEYFRERIQIAALQDEGDIETWARNAAAHYGRKRRIDLLTAARTLVSSGAGPGSKEQVVRVEVSQKPDDYVAARCPDVIPVQGGINDGSENGDDESWDFDNARASNGAEAAANGASEVNGENVKTEVDENGWDFDDVEDTVSAPDSVKEGPVQLKEDDEGEDDPDAWGWGDGDAVDTDDSTLATSEDSNGSLPKPPEQTNGHTTNGNGASEDSAWDSVWEEPAQEPSPVEPFSPPKEPKLAKRLEKFSMRGKDKSLASPSIASNPPSSPYPTSPFPSSISSNSSHIAQSPRHDSVHSSSSPQNSYSAPTKPTLPPVLQKPKEPEMYTISGRAQDFVRLITDILSEGHETAYTNVFKDFLPSSSPSDLVASAPPSTLILQAAPSALDLYRAVYPVTFRVELTRPERALRFVNDCTYISEEVAKVDLPESVTPTVREQLHESLERLRELGEWWFDEGVERQRELVLQVLSRAENFVDTGDQERFDECESVMSEVLRSVRTAASQWKAVLPRTKYYSATGQVVEAALTKILDDVLALPDIPELDSRKLSELCRILFALEGLFVDAEDPDSPSVVVAYVPSWLKYSYLSELLEASIADISYLFGEGALIDFRVEELVNVVRALFADTPLRASTIAKLQSGHLVAAAESE